jgi:hypothetical protein
VDVDRPPTPDAPVVAASTADRPSAAGKHGRSRGEVRGLRTKTEQ